MNVESADKHTQIQGLALRLYNPEAHQWGIYWVNGADGVLEPNPMVGEFNNGRGNSITNKSMRVERSMPDSFGQASTRILYTSSSRFLQMGENVGTNWITYTG